MKGRANLSWAFLCVALFFPLWLCGESLFIEMISYEVTIRLDDPALGPALEAYMHDKHLAEVFATGCFLDARFEKSAPDTYRSRYTVASQAELDRYVAEHAPRLRTDFLAHFPTGLTITRDVWTLLTSR